MWNLAPLPRNLRATLADARHPKTKVRRSAAADLGRHLLESSEGRDELIAALRGLLEDPLPELRIAACLAAADGQAVEVVDRLLELVQSSHTAVAQHALLALGELPGGAERSVPVVRAHLEDPRAALRFQALIALHRLAPGAAPDALIAHFEDEDAEVRHVAVRCWESLRFDDVEGLPTVSQPELAALRRRLTDESLPVRVLAALLLGRLGEAEARPVIVECLRSSSPSLDPEDEAALIALAGELDLQEARPALRRRAFGGLLSAHRHAWHARVALARLGDEAAIATFRAELRAWSAVRRTLAVAAIGQARLVEFGAEVQRQRGRGVPEDTIDAALAALGQSPSSPSASPRAVDPVGR